MFKEYDIEASEERLRTNFNETKKFSNFGL